MDWRNGSRALLGSAVVLCTLARAANAQFEWKPGFQWPGGNGLNNRVLALTEFTDGTGAALYAGGAFTIAGAVPANYIAKWNGTNWAALGSGMGGSGQGIGVVALTVFNDGTGAALYAGGAFTMAGGGPASNIAKWDGTTWTPLGNGITGDLVAGLAVFNDGSGDALYAVGAFTMAGGVPANNIAKWDGTNWTPLGSGITAGEGAGSLTVFDDGTGQALYVGGTFTMAGGVAANNVARWDGANWTTLDSGLTGANSEVVGTLTTFDDGTGAALYAGGAFTMAGGVAALSIAKWDGTTWAPLGAGLDGFVEASAVFDECPPDNPCPALYVGGGFTDRPASHIAKWDGTTWTSLGTGVDRVVLALSRFDNGTGAALYAGGLFTTAGGQASNNVAKWGGQ